VNAKLWDALALAHGRGSDAYYDVEALIAGRSSLSDVEDAASRESVGDVNGLDVLLAYATLGVLCWIADLDAWMRSVRSALRPGGRLVVVDLHPMLVMVQSRDPLRFDMPYAFDGPREFADPESYAGVATAGGGRNVNYAHSLGEVVSAAVAAGFSLEALHEHLDAAFDPRGTC
jgi:SAM-dependent methyltransferase